MNLESKLNESLNDVLRSAGYIFEIIGNNKKQSNLITGTNNQLISPAITVQLSNSIDRFDGILDDTVSKFNDARWCVEQILENKQKQEELKMKEEIERQKRKEEEERKMKENEEKARKRAEEEKKQKEEEERQRQQKEQANVKEDSNNDLEDFGFDFNLADFQDNDKNNGLDIPNPSDILSSISYTGSNKTTNNDNDNSTSKASEKLEPDLDMNNLLGNDELLDGLNMSRLDQDFNTNSNDQTNLDALDEDFDVDNFLNQFGGGD